jgi:heme exporter protein C
VEGFLGTVGNGFVPNLTLGIGATAWLLYTNPVLALVALFTGAFWGKPTWGTYWIWDAKLTSTLILLFVYVGVMALRTAFDSDTAGSKAASVLTLVGVVNLPIIYYAAYWWNTLHQRSSELGVRDASANPPEIWIPAFFSGFGLIGLIFLVIILHTRNEILLRERRAQWVQELVQQAAAQNEVGNA